MLFGEIKNGEMKLNDVGSMIQTVWNVPTRRHATLGDVVGAFKSITTVQYIAGVKQKRWSEFDGRIWHWNYYEHIIRHPDALNRIRRYIELNPSKWNRDQHNPIHS